MGLGHIAGQGQHQGDGVFCSRGHVASGGIGNDNARLGGGGDIDVVHAHAGAGDDLNRMLQSIADRLIHASLVDGIRLCSAQYDTFKHMDMKHLRKKLELHQDKRTRLIVTDGVFSMDGDLIQLDEVCALADEFDAMVLVDDSHASGFIGKTGRGTHEHCGLFGKIGEDYDYKVEDLANGNVKVVFNYIAGASEKADLSDNTCD